MCERCITYLNNILCHKRLGSARRMLCSDMWQCTVLSTDLEDGGSRSHHHLNHSCATLKLRWRFQSTKLKYNFRNKDTFFNFILKVKLKVTLTKFFEEDSLFRSRLHMDGEVLHHLIPRICLNTEVRVLETSNCSCYEYLGQSFITTTHKPPPYLLRWHN
jgi:hypothetical protein